jgi:asparagine synthase (glutamine-hydrolysing)
MPWELDGVVEASIARLGLRRLNPIWHIERLLRPQPSTSFGKIAALESSLYMRNQLLRDTDWASMAHSLEVRVPLVDVQLLIDVAPITTKHNLKFKHLLANSPSLPLPAKVVERPKTGFGTPIQAWLQNDTRIQRWRRVPAFAVDTCPWARRWAFEVAVT